MGYAPGQEGDALDHHEGPDHPAAERRQQPGGQGGLEKGMVAQG
jgi:hypothetical protein